MASKRGRKGWKKKRPNGNNKLLAPVARTDPVRGAATSTKQMTIGNGEGHKVQENESKNDADKTSPTSANAVQSHLELTNTGTPTNAVTSNQSSLRSLTWDDVVCRSYNQLPRKSEEEDTTLKRDCWALFNWITGSQNGSEVERFGLYSLCELVQADGEDIGFLLTTMLDAINTGIKKHPDDAELLAKGANAIIISVPVLVSMLVSRMGEAYHVYGILLTLTNIFASKVLDDFERDAEDTFLKSGGIQAVAASMKEYPDSENIQRIGLDILYDIAHVNCLRGNCCLLDETDFQLILDGVGTVMSTHGNSLGRSITACSILRRIIRSGDEGMRLFLEKGSLQVVLQALKNANINFPAWERVAEIGLSVSLTVPGALMKNKEGVDVTLTTMKRYSDYDIHECHVLYIRCKAFDIDMVNLFETTKLIEVFAEVAMKHLGNSGLVEDTGIILGRLFPCLDSRPLEWCLQFLYSLVKDALPPKPRALITAEMLENFEKYYTLGDAAVVEDDVARADRFVDGIVVTMHLYEERAELQAAACSLLAKIIQNHKDYTSSTMHASPIVSHKWNTIITGALQPILSAMERFPLDERVQHGGCYALQLAASDSLLPRTAILDATSILRARDLIMAAVLKFPLNETIVDNGGRFLFSQAYSSGTLDQDVSPANSRSVPQIINEMKEHRSDGLYQTSSSLILWWNAAACINDVPDDTTVTSEMILSIIMSLKLHPSRVALQRTACLSLCHLGIRIKAVARGALQHGAVALLLRVMGAQIHDSDVQIAVMRLFVYYLQGGDGDTRETAFAQLIDNDTIKGISHSMQSHPEVFVIQELGLSINAHLSEKCSNVDAAVFLPTCILAVMTKYHDSFSIHEGSCTILANLLYNKKLTWPDRGKVQAAVFEAGVVESVTSSLGMVGGTHDQCVNHIVDCLMILMCFASYGAISAETLSAVLSVMEEFSDTVSVQRYGTQFLHCAAQANSNLHLLRTSGALYLILRQAMTKYAGNKSLQRDGREIISSLAPWVPLSFGQDLFWNESISTETLQRIFNAAKDDPDGKNFQSEALSAFKRLAKFEDFSVTLQSLGGIQGITRTLEAFVDNPELCVVAIEALTKILSRDNEEAMTHDPNGTEISKRQKELKTHAAASYIPSQWNTHSISILLKAMQRYIHWERFQELTCHLLLQLTSDTFEGKMPILEILSQQQAKSMALLPAITTYPSNFNIFQDGGTTFFRVKHFEEKQ